MAWTQVDFVACSSTLHVKQFDVEDQRGVWRDDAAGAAGAIAELRRDDQSALAADFHGRHTFIPAGDHLPPADRKFKRLAAVDRAVELLALGAAFIKPARIVHDADLTRPGRSAGAEDRKSTRLNSSHVEISYAVFCL